MAGRRAASARDEADERSARLLRELSDAAMVMERSATVDGVLRVATDRARQLLGAESAAARVDDSGWGTTCSIAVASPSGGRAGDRSSGTSMADAELVAPLSTPAGTTIGRLEVAHDHPHAFTSAEAAVLHHLAVMVSRELEHARLSDGGLAPRSGPSSSRHDRAQREAFLGVLSHELRTPITTIYAGARLLARDGPIARSTHRGLANDVADEAERLFHLVEDVLVLARAERGVLELAHEPVLVQRVVAAAVRLERVRWPATEFVVQCPDEVPAASGDAIYAEQVVRNLLSNAAKYGPAGAQVLVTIGADGDEIAVRVLDRGRGLGRLESGELFDLFYRSPSMSAQAAGAGIGLFVCRQLVEQMGGRIWARPRDGGGSEFGFALRAYRDDA